MENKDLVISNVETKHIHNIKGEIHVIVNGLFRETYPCLGINPLMEQFIQKINKIYFLKKMGVTSKHELFHIMEKENLSRFKFGDCLEQYEGLFHSE